MSGRDLFWFFAGALVSLAVSLMTRAWLRSATPATGSPSPDTSAATSTRSPSADTVPASPIPLSSTAAASLAAPALTSMTAESATESNDSARPLISSIAVPIAAAIALVAVALGIYFMIGSPDSIAAGQPRNATMAQRAAQPPEGHTDLNTGSMKAGSTAGSLDEVTRGLAARLAANGGSDADWNLLAQSYEYMGRTEEAQAARMHLAAADAANTGASTGTARAADAGTAMAVNLGAASGLTGPAAAEGAQPASNATRETPSGTARITGSVNITGALAGKAASGSTLFIYAKSPGAPGPPLAVLRVRVDKWPVAFVLDDSNSMVPGRSLSTASAPVKLEARISRSGEALPQSGDLVGSLPTVDPHATKAVTISIDHEIG